MVNFITSILSLLLMVLIALIAATVVISGFIGVGALFARFTELTLFQATVVAVPVGIAVLYLLGRIMNLPVTTWAEEWDEKDDWDEELELEDLPPEERCRVLRSIAGRG